MTPHDVAVVLASGHLFDESPDRGWTELFLGRDGHHLLLAFIEEEPVGFVTGVEITHPDKGTELLLYELGVDEGFRRRGIGRQLVRSLAELARARGCHGMWVPVDSDDGPALALYQGAGATGTEAATIAWWDLRHADPEQSW
jgi:ribosomal protein S18 acetylase RimI-like enzyme